jgi:pyruvate carboxylase subunit B
VTPGSQQYWLQAFNNVLYGRWEKIEQGYGMAVLGYFGRTPLPPDPDVVKRASEQLGMPPFDGDPLEAAPKTMDQARAALQEHGLEVTDENTFLVLAAMVPGRKMESNEGIRLLEGRGKVDIPLKAGAAGGAGRREAAAPAAAAAAPAPGSVEREGAAGAAGPVTTRCTVREGGRTRTFTVTLEPVAGGLMRQVPEPVAGEVSKAAPPAAGATGGGEGRDVYSTFAGAVEVVDVMVKVGDHVEAGSVIAAVEAMKAKHDIRSPHAGTVRAVHVKVGDEIDSTRPLVTIA